MPLLTFLGDAVLPKLDAGVDEERLHVEPLPCSIFHNIELGAFKLSHFQPQIASTFLLL